MENDELEILIPSKTVRDYVVQTDWTFTDAQKAALLAHGWISDLPLSDQLSHLKTLRDSTDDTELKAQITTYLDRMERSLHELMDYRDNCIYVLKIENDEYGDNYHHISPEGYYFDWDTACVRGWKHNRRFQIEKLFVEDENDCENYVIAYIHFDKNGDAVYLSNELNAPEREPFLDTFFPLPNPFERGDIVRRVGSDRSEDFGIVETSQKECQEDYERRKSKSHLFTEFGDDRIRVVFLNDDGTFSHAHVIPMYLERYQPEWGPHDTEDGTRDNLLLAASDMYKGEGSLDELWYFTMEYRHVKKDKAKE